jgi:hypothetical protein
LVLQDLAFGGGKPVDDALRGADLFVPTLGRWHAANEAIASAAWTPLGPPAWKRANICTSLTVTGFSGNCRRAFRGRLLGSVSS